MPARSNLDEEGRRLATKLRIQLGDELRRTRETAGLSQKAVGLAVGMSHAQLGRIERGKLPQLTLEQACRAGMALGLELGAKLYPDGDPVRDRAQLKLLGAIPRATPDRGERGTRRSHCRSPAIDGRGTAWSGSAGAGPDARPRPG